LKLQREGFKVGEHEEIEVTENEVSTIEDLPIQTEK